MQTERRGDLASLIPLFARLSIISVVLWVVASVVLAIPHGPGHSIESMTPFVVLRDAALPLWVGALAGVLIALALRAWRSLESR